MAKKMQGVDKEDRSKQRASRQAHETNRIALDGMITATEIRSEKYMDEGRPEDAEDSMMLAKDVEVIRDAYRQKHLEPDLA